MTGWMVAFALAQALDAGSTCAALARGGRESNPMLPESCSAIIGIKSAVTVGYGYGMRPMFRHHPKTAKIVTGVITGATLAVALHNMQR